MKICLNCKKEFEPKEIARKFCSRECYAKYPQKGLTHARSKKRRYFPLINNSEFYTNQDLTVDLKQ